MFRSYSQRSFGLVLFMVLAAHTYSQNSFTEFFGGPLAHDGIGLVESTAGWNVGVRAYGGESAGYQAVLAKRNNNGSAQLETTFDLPDRAFLQAMAPAADGGSYLCGSLLPAGGPHQGLLLRLDQAGELLWQRSLPTAESVQFLALSALDDGSVALCGMAQGAEDHNVLIARYSSDGDFLWSRIESSALDSEAYGIAANSSGIMITGRQSNFGGGSDALFLHYSLDGSLLMTTSWGGVENEEGRALIATPDGNFVMAGATRSYGPADAQGRRRSNLHLIKVDMAGDTLWTRTYGDIMHDRLVSAADQASNGDLLIAGSKVGAGIQLNEKEAWVARIAANGDLVWERSYPLDRSAGLRDIRALSNGFAACGWSFGPEGRRVVLLRRDPNGQ